MEMKFDYPETAYLVTRETRSILDKCEICEGDGNVRIKGKTYICPECNGSGGHHHFLTEYAVSGPARFKSLSYDYKGRVELQYEVVTHTIYNNECLHDVFVSPENLYENEQDARFVAASRNRMAKAVGL